MVNFLDEGDNILKSLFNLIILSTIVSIFLCGLKECFSVILGCKRKTKRYIDINVLHQVIREEIERRSGAIDEYYGR